MYSLRARHCIRIFIQQCGCNGDQAIDGGDSQTIDKDGKEGWNYVSHAVYITNTLCEALHCSCARIPSLLVRSFLAHHKVMSPSYHFRLHPLSLLSTETFNVHSYRGSTHKSRPLNYLNYFAPQCGRGS